MVLETSDGSLEAFERRSKALPAATNSVVPPSVMRIAGNKIPVAQSLFLNSARPTPLARLQPLLDLVQIDVVNGSDIERQHLGENQPAHHRQPQRTPRFRACAQSERNRQSAHQRSHG